MLEFVGEKLATVKVLIAVIFSWSLAAADEYVVGMKRAARLIQVVEVQAGVNRAPSLVEACHGE